MSIRRIRDATNTSWLDLTTVTGLKVRNALDNGWIDLKTKAWLIRNAGNTAWLDTLTSISASASWNTIIDLAPNAKHQFLSDGTPYGLWIDGPLIPYKGGDGNNYGIVAHSENYRMRIPSFTSGATWVLDATPAYEGRQTLESQYNNRKWIMGVWAQGSTITGVAHMEWYQTQKTVDGIAGFDAIGNNRWITSPQWVRSTDNGRTFAPWATASSARVLLVPEPWAVQSHEGTYGYYHITNIVKEGSYYYCFCEARDLPSVAAKNSSGAVLLRTTDISTPLGWQFWNGSGWTTVDHGTYQGNQGPVGQRPYLFWRINGWDPYTVPDRNGRAMQSVRFHPASNQWIVFGFSYNVGGTGGLCYSTSPTLANPLFEVGGLKKVASQGTLGDYGGAHFISVFDPSYDNSDNQVFQKIGNNPIIIVPFSQTIYKYKTLTLS